MLVLFTPSCIPAVSGKPTDPHFTQEQAVCLAAAEIEADASILLCKRDKQCISEALEAQREASFACIGLEAS